MRAPMGSTPPETLARRLGVSTEAVELARDADFLDLHLDAHIPIRLFGHDVRRRHAGAPLFGVGFGHFDVPRGRDGGLDGALWSITTNPFRTRAGRWRTFLRNLDRLREIVAASAGSMRLVRSADEYRRARASGAFACMASVQGANCLDGALGGPGDVPDRLLVRACLMHLTHSRLGASSAPFGGWRRDKGLRAAGRALVEQLDAERVFVDLAHAHPETFWDAVDAHDATLPLLCTHTGVHGVHPCWRNLSDAQLRAVADTGGVVGIIYSSYFLVPRGERASARWVLAHLEHAISVAGEEHVGIGSDHDGFIIPPWSLRSADRHPRLVQLMLDAGWTDTRVRRVLGQNFLRAFEILRPGSRLAEQGPSARP